MIETMAALIGAAEHAEAVTFTETATAHRWDCERCVTYPVPYATRALAERAAVSHCATFAFRLARVPDALAAALTVNIADVIDCDLCDAPAGHGCATWCTGADDDVAVAS